MSAFEISDSNTCHQIFAYRNTLEVGRATHVRFAWEFAFETGIGARITLALKERAPTGLHRYHAAAITVYANMRFANSFLSFMLLPSEDDKTVPGYARRVGLTSAQILE